MEKQTLEKKAATKNGVSRMIFVGLSILIEAAIIIALFTVLNGYAEWINLFTRTLAIILVLVIYGQNKTSSMKMPWIMLIMAFPVFGVVLYLLIGLNGSTWKMKDRYKRIDEILLPFLTQNKQCMEDLENQEPKAAAIAKYLWKNAGYPVYQNTQVEYFSEAVEGLESQLEALTKAEHFIFMEYHAIEDKEAWGRIQKVLVERAEAGVEVRVFYDDMGSIGFINTDFVKKMKCLGIRCRVFNPVMPGLNIFLNNRDHRKITVIDGKVGYTGGYNLANEYFNITHPYGQWKDTGIKVTGQAVRSMTVTFLEMWNAVKKSDLDDVEFARYLPKQGDEPKQGDKPKQGDEPAYEVQDSGFIQPYADSPMDDIHVGEDVYISMINKADKYCYFITPYLIITDEMTHAMCLAAKRGVDVRIITPGIPDKKMVYSVTRSFYHALVRDGVRIFEWTPGFCHAKMCIVDDAMATCGTINLDYRSLYHHFENGCFLYDCQAVLDMKKDFDATFAESREVTEQYRSGRSAVMRAGQLILRLFAELL